LQQGDDSSEESSNDESIAEESDNDTKSDTERHIWITNISRLQNENETRSPKKRITIIAKPSIAQKKKKEAMIARREARKQKRKYVKDLRPDFDANF
jgi:hypothetical protein